MATRIEIRPNRYHDSVQLMFVTSALLRMSGIEQCFIAMGTPTNKTIFADLGLSSDEVSQANPNDMVIGIKAVDHETCDNAMAEMDDLFARGSQSSAGKSSHATFEAALEATPQANLCVISVPGEYARAEAEKALDAGLHVLLFSDNVSFEDELALKTKAQNLGLLCMGPDCGVANINGVSLLVGSIIGKGPIGICGASGAGIQQVAALIDMAGSGVSQAIGTGGRDLRDEIGAITMLSAIEALEQDPETKVIVLISRMPGPKSLEAVLERVTACNKPVICNMIGCAADQIKAAGAMPAANLEEAACQALELIKVASPLPESSEMIRVARQASQAMSPEQKYVRGLFCSGTFCEETMTAISPLIGGIHSNVPIYPGLKLVQATVSVEHSIVDYGEEEFTAGRPHPVLDPEIRRRGILREAQDPETAVLLMDFILGPAVHPDPVGVVIDDICEARKIAESRGGNLAVVASICGTDRDPQNRATQAERLRQAGVLVAASNIQAARLAGEIARIRGGE